MSYFAQPYWLLVSLIIIVLVSLLMAYGEFQKNQALAKLTNKALKNILTSSVSLVRIRLKQVLFLTALVCFGLALARPYMGYRWEEVKRKGIDILFAIDTSRSMLAQDIRPNRLERSKLAIIDFSHNFSGGRLGLVPFAGSAFLMCPLTLDVDSFYESLETLDTSVISRPGTNIGAAIREASEAFSKGSGGEKILVLITDGEDLEGEGLAAAKEAAEQGVKIYAVGVGTSSGDLIPQAPSQGSATFMKDPSGNFVKSRLNEKVLKEIASLTGGSYYPLGSNGEGLESIMRDNQHLMKEFEMKESMRKVPIEGFQWPLALGLIILLVQTLLRDTSQKLAITKKGSLPKRTFLNQTTLLLMVLFSLHVDASASVQQAEQNMKSGKFSEAIIQYQNAAKEEPDNTSLIYNQGVAAYRAGQFSEAAEAFTTAKQSRDLTLQRNAYYNLGNTLFRVGESTLKNNHKETIKQWENSLEAYQGALALNSDDQAAKNNYDIVKKRLEELKKNPPPEDQNDKQDKNDQKDQQDQKNQDQQKEQKEQKDKSEPDKKQDENKSSSGSDQSNSKSDPKSDSKSDPKSDQKKSEEPTPADKKEDKAKPKPSQEAKEDENAGEKPKEAQSAQITKPGQMTPDEARALLNAVKNQQKQLLLPVNRSKESKPDSSPAQDW